MTNDLNIHGQEKHILMFVLIIDVLIYSVIYLFHVALYIISHLP